MKKLLIAAIAALMLVPSVAAEPLYTMEDPLYIDVTGVFQRSFDTMNTAQNRLALQGALLAKVAGGFYFGFQGETAEGGGDPAGGAMAFYRLPWYIPLDDQKENLIGFEIVGWGNLTEKAFNFKEGSAGIGVIWMPKKDARTSINLRFLIDGYEQILSIFVPPDPQAVAAAHAAGTDPPQGSFVDVEDRGTDFSLAFGVRVALFD